jgi:hypothetical protein
MAKEKNSGWDNEENAVQSSWVKFNVPLEDKVMGTLVEKRSQTNQEGRTSPVYDMVLDEGTWHILDDKKKVVDEPVTAKAGDFVSIGSLASIDRQMKNIVKGQKIGLKFIEEVANKDKKKNPSKVVRVYVIKNEDGTPKMDEAFLAKNAVETF